MHRFRKPISFVLISAGLVAAQSGLGGFRYLEYPETRPGKILKAIKVLDPGTGKIRTQVYEDGAELAIPITQLEQQEAAVRASRKGAFSDEVMAALPSLDPDGKIRVSIRMKYPPIRYPDKTRVSPEEARAASLAAANLQPIRTVNDLARKYGIQGLAFRGNDIAEGELSRDQVESLKYDADIGIVDLQSKDGPTAVELSTLTASAFNPGPVPSSSGAGVKAATFETGVTASFLSCIGVTPAASDLTSAKDDYTLHSNLTFSLLARMAPSAALYHHAAPTFDGTGDINYMVNNGIQTVSSSWSRGSASPYHSTYPEFLVMDDFAYRFPYPVFVTPSGNSGYAYEVNWQCYNALSVGNVRHTNNSTYELAECTQTKNPPPVYGSCIAGSGADCAGDREMPHLVVPGIPSSGSTFQPSCGDGINQPCGTSWSAPIGNGLAADVISADSRMVSWPEKVRATLVLTAHNVDAGNWAVGGDERDGTGTASGADAVAFAQSHTTVSPGNSAVEKGMGAGAMYASDFSSGNKRFNYLVPNPKPSGKHLRVVLTWDSNPVVGGTVNALSDLDLVVQKNGGTQGSSSWDSNIEVVDVSASELNAGGSYYIDISPYANRIPASGARTNYFYYSIAWSWVKDHAD